MCINNNFMKKNLFLTLLFLSASLISLAQLTGVKTIPGDYPSVAAAISALNTQGVGIGGVIFNVAAGHTETFTGSTSGALTTSTSSETKPIVFQKAGEGANPVITAYLLPSVSSTAAIIVLAGTDYVTFDGIDLVENSLNTSFKTKWGYAILMASISNASHHIKIKNCTISLDKSNTTTVGIYSKNHTMSSTTLLYPASNDAVVSYCDVDNCMISNVYTGIYFVGVDAAPQSYHLYGQGNRFGFASGNTISNYGGLAAATYGIYTGFQNNLVVANNIISNNDQSSGIIGGIQISTAHAANVDIYSNKVTLSSMGTNFYDDLSAINNFGSSVPGSNIVNIYDNIIENCTMPIGTSANWYLLSNSASALEVNIYDNVIRNNTRASTGGHVYLINLNLASSIVTENVYNNHLYGNIVTGTSSQSNLHCIYANNRTTTKNIYSNLIYNNSTVGSTVNGIYSSNYGGTTIGTTTNIYQNNIYGISSDHATAAVNGIKLDGGDYTKVYNNIISDLTTPNSSTENALNGISIISGNNVGVFYNTVYLKGLSTDANFGSACIFANTIPNVELKNNIFINSSLASGSGKSVSYWRSGSALDSYVTFSGNNNFYAGTPGPQNLIFFNGTTGYQTINAFTAAVYPAETNSFTELSPFLNTTSTPYDLHISESIASQCESGGAISESTVNITTDFSNTPRFPNTGYPNNPAYNAVAPDAGAYEFGGLAADLTAPVIVFTPLTNTSLTSARTFNVTVSDATAVPTSGIGLPVCYWKINSGNYVAVQSVYNASLANYTFTIGGNVSQGDVISYYFVSQDMVSPPNIGANPATGASGFSANPPSCTTPPTYPYTYSIVQALSGAITVGSGGTYTSLTGASGLFHNMNTKALNGDLMVKVISDLTETGENALNKWIEDGIGDYTVTIQSDAATERSIYGNVSNSMIRFNGCKNVVIDGRFNESGKYLKFKNLNTENANFEFVNGASFNTLRDCIWESGNTSSNEENAGVIRFYTSNSSSGNSNNSLINNIIRNISSTSSRPHSGILSYGSPLALNANNTISGNEILNFTSYGLYVSSNTGDNWNISGNSFFNKDADMITSAVRCLYFDGGESSNNNIIAGNYIGGTDPMCQGESWKVNILGVFYGIYISAGNVAATEIYNNVVSKVHNVSTAGSFSGIVCTSDGIFHIGNLGPNIIGSETEPNSILFNGTSGFRGIQLSGTNLNNTIENNIIGNVVYTKITGSALNCYGISVFSAKVSKNKVFKLGSTEPGFNPTIYGIFNTGVNGMTNEYTNNIVDLDGGASGDPTLYAFWDDASIQSGTKLFFNTFYIHSAANSTASTYVWRRDFGSITEMKDNIFYNATPAGGTGSHYAVYNGITPGLTSDYNDLMSVAGPLGHYAMNEVSNLQAWQAATSGDLNSVSADPLFESESDLHPSNPLLSKAGIAIEGITTDYSGVTRTNPPDIGAYEFQLDPVIRTLAASSLVGVTAVLNGEVNPFGLSIAVSFEYGLTNSYGQSVIAVPAVIIANENTAFSAFVESLLPSTTYHFRSVGMYDGITIYGENMTFTTSTIPPTVITYPASNVLLNAATLNGSVNANGESSTVTFEYGPTTAYGSVIAAVPSIVEGNTFTEVFADISNLEDNTVYHFRAVATNATGTTYGSDKQFLTGCTVPSAAGPITGANSICTPATGITYSIELINNADSYIWNVPSGVIITSGNETNAITVNFNQTAVSGNITVKGVNDCGTGAVSTLALSVNPTPPTPIISLDMFALTSSAPTGNQWYRNGTIIPGAVNQTFEVLENGDYSVQVTLNNCESEFSNIVSIINVGIQSLKEQSFMIYPNPNTGAFWISLNIQESSNLDVKVLNNMGEVVFQTKLVAIKGNHDEFIDLKRLSNGIYTIILQTDQLKSASRLVINK